jgi:hypothetical protein
MTGFLFIYLLPSENLYMIGRYNRVICWQPTLFIYKQRISMWKIKSWLCIDKTVKVALPLLVRSDFWIKGKVDFWPITNGWFFGILMLHISYFVNLFSYVLIIISLTFCTTIFLFWLIFFKKRNVFINLMLARTEKKWSVLIMMHYRGRWY